MKVTLVGRKIPSTRTAAVGSVGGFTIIEVMLFLSVTGLMMLGIFIGINGTISRQIYENEIVSLVDFVQEQYNLVDNVRNNRDLGVGCSPLGGVVAVDAEVTRGTSDDCTIIGRWVTIDDAAANLVSRPVYSTVDITFLDTSVASELEYIESMGLVVAEDDIAQDDIYLHKIDSGSVYVNANSSRQDFSILILKLPLNGVTRTHVLGESLPVGEEPIAAMLNHAELDQQPLRLCIDSERIGSPEPAGVRVMPLTGSVAGVQRISASERGDSGCRV